MPFDVNTNSSSPSLFTLIEEYYKANDKMARHLNEIIDLSSRYAQIVLEAQVEADAALLTLPAFIGAEINEEHSLALQKIAHERDLAFTVLRVSKENLLKGRLPITVGADDPDFVDDIRVANEK